MIYILFFSVFTFAKSTSPCIEDINKFCGKLSPGAGAVVSCMKKANSDNLLSPECKKYFDDVLRDNQKIKTKDI